MKQVVSSQVKNKIAIITIFNPPVNSLSAAVREQLLFSIEKSDDDENIEAIIIKGGGKTFPVGADIKEFKSSPKHPHLPHICDRIENCRKPVVVAMHGMALGGGLEVALSGHFRIAMRDTKVGLPEILLGLIPGAGGTQRLPRLVGVKAALDIMASGAKICAETAFNMNILDEIVEDLENAPLRFVDTILKHNKGFSRTRDVSDRILNNSENRSILVAKRHKLDLQKNTLLAHYKILECLEAVLNMSFEDGLSFEITAFADLLINDQSKGMIHAFFAERQTSKLPELRRAKPKNLQKIAVIGGGTMGSGITIAAMKAGLEVIMIERNTKTLDQGRSKVLRVLERDVQKSRLTEAKKSTLMQLYSGATDYSKLQGVDLVIEAVYEDMEVKKEVFKALDRSLPEQTILASNTSYLDIDEIASVTKRPQNVIGLHFFSPANIMRLLEIVVPERASDEVIATGFDLAKKMKKIPVRAGNCDGFIGNRILSAYTEVASFMMEDGASPYEIDQAVRAFGYPIGPYQMFDLAGGDIGWATRKRQASFRDSDSRYVSIADRLCERGWFGQKTGRGFYRYDVGHQRGTEDPEVIKIVEIERNKKGIKPRKFSQQEILRRYIAAMVNEAANVLNEGFACRPSDIDVVKLFGYGFPRFRGGPMKYADTYGLEEIIEDINKFSQEDKIFWKPSPLLLSLVERGENFESLNV